MGELTIARRGFLKGAASLTFGLVLTPGRLLAAANVGPAFSPSALLRIDPDNTVRIIMPHAEMGQGAYTGLAQILADELDADWALVVAEHLNSLDDAFKHRAWGAIATGASTSINSQWPHLREIGATARAMLVAAAAQRWGVPAQSLTTNASTVVDAAHERRATYGELTGAAAALSPPDAVTLKTRDEFRIIGQSVPRVDRIPKSNGAAVFGIDLQLPDMLTASIAHAPVFGGKLRSFKADAAKAMPGVRAVVAIPTGVAVVADSFWQAKKAKDALVIDWDEGEFAQTSSADLWREYSAMADRAGPLFEQRGKPDFAASATVIEGEFRFPFLAHAPMEPLNATVQLDGDRCEIWAGTQFQGIDVGNIERLTGVPAAQIRINTQWLGGSFGRRAAPGADFLVEAVQIAQAAGLAQPIKMIWQREDDIQGGFYRPMVLHRYRIGLDEQKLPRHWAHSVVGASISKGTAFESAFMVDGLDTLSTEGLRHTKYAVDNVEFTLHTPKHPLEVLWWRSEADSHTGPAVEAIMNRLAREASVDPIAYRRQLLAGNKDAFRIVGVLDALEDAADWHTAPPPDVFRGVAVHPSFGSVAGYVVELKKTGTQLAFHKVTAAMDCGLVVNPHSVRAQICSAVAFALSTVIGQKIEIERGRAKQSNFHDYTVARLREVPNVEVVLVDNGLDHPTGVGEVGVPPFIPALTEAVFAATGQEIVEFPMVLEGYTFSAS
jgi:isoquinoline 1-oxidoreductase beta subunit